MAETVGLSELSEMTLTGDQQAALDDFLIWYEGYRNGGHGARQFIKLGGYAGTGKTTLVAQICRRLGEGVRVHFCAFTMKAASVLRASLKAQGLEVNDGRKAAGGGRKKGYPVTTIHGLLYSPLELVWCARSGELLGTADGEEPRAMRCESADCAALGGGSSGSEADCPTRSEITWDRKQGGPQADLVVLDEASMVSKEAWEDILSLGLPVLAVGDHGQLPPVKSQFSLLRDGVDLELREITRQGADSAIIRVASAIREWKGVRQSREPLEYAIYDGRPESFVAKIHRAQMGILPGVLGDGSDPVWVCGYNRTRATWNQVLRGQRGLTGGVSVGDRVICLKNTLTTYNGQLARVLSVAEVSGRPGVVELTLEPEDAAERAALGDAPLVVQVPREQFGRDKTMTTDEMVMGGYRGCGLWDFGYVITVHKSQGSTFNNVVVLEERLPGSDEDFRRWLYTAVTRARYSVVIIK